MTGPLIAVAEWMAVQRVRNARVSILHHDERSVLVRTKYRDDPVPQLTMLKKPQTSHRPLKDWRRG